jgi:hypothetical protein
MPRFAFWSYGPLALSSPYATDERSARSAVIIRPISSELLNMWTSTVEDRIHCQRTDELRVF